MVNEIARLRGEVRELTAMLAEAEARSSRDGRLSEIGQLASGIAHEINTPVQFIGDNVTFLQAAFETLVGAVSQRGADAGPAQTLPLDYVLEQVPLALTQTMEGIERVAAIVAGLRQLAHPGGDELAETDVRSLCEVAATVTRHEWKYVAQLVNEVELAAVWCQRDRMLQVLVNLVVNAAQAVATRTAGAGPLGTVRLAGGPTPGGGCILEVSDDGCGIPPEIAARIFDPFFTTKPCGRGTGQGLAIARSIVVDAHGGELRCRSDGRGTTFTIVLPGARAQPRGAA